MSSLQLCTYSQSEVYSQEILEKCPLKLSDSNHDLCWCSKRINVPHKQNSTISLRVLSCTYPRLWNGRRIMDPFEVRQKIEHKARKRKEQNKQKPKETTEELPFMNEQKPLWAQPIPIIGVTGPYASGKTLFPLQLDPAHTRVYDTEKSCQTYAGLGFDRVDVPVEMMKKFSRGYKPIDTFNWWREDIKKIEPGKYRVIVLDTALEIESGIADWVLANPEYFNRSRAQYIKMSGLMWGDVKEYWKTILSDIASRCETFVFTVHMGEEYVGGKPSGRKKPKGKSTLMELASLFLQMERKADKAGNVPQVPSAVVLKSRLAHTSFVGGKVKIVSALPPRLPVATPDSINEYLLNPPDYSNLKEEEKAPEVQVTEEEMERLRAHRAETEVEAERLKLERLNRKDQRRQQVQNQSQEQKAVQKPVQKPIPAEPKSAATPKTTEPDKPIERHPNHAKLENLIAARHCLFQAANITNPEIQKQKWAAILAHYNVTTAKDLPADKIEELIGLVHKKADEFAEKTEPTINGEKPPF